MREPGTGPIHPLVPCPLGLEPARQPGSWQASVLVSQAGAALDAFSIQQGQKCAPATSQDTFGWLLLPSLTVQVCALHILPKPPVTPDVPVHVVLFLW